MGIAIELESFTAKFLSTEILENHLQLCGGEEQNGFELWRNLHLQYAGTSQVVEVGGLQKFMKFPKCNDESKLVQHLANWEDQLTKYGEELRKTPEVLRIMMLDIVPTELANKINSKVKKFPTWQDVVQHVKEKLDWRRQVEITQALHGTSR